MNIGDVNNVILGDINIMKTWAITGTQNNYLIKLNKLQSGTLMQCMTKLKDMVKNGTYQEFKNHYDSFGITLYDDDNSVLCSFTLTEQELKKIIDSECVGDEQMTEAEILVEIINSIHGYNAK